MTENEIARIVVDAALEVHRGMGGPGLIEDVYEEALALELRQRGLTAQRQVAFPIFYKGTKLTRAIRVDLLVERTVIVESKAQVRNDESFRAQALTYLRSTGLRLALVISFGQRFLKHGISRVVNGLPEA